MTDLINRFRGLFEYHEDGYLINRTERCKRHAKKGDRVGANRNNINYRQVRVDGKNYREHVVIWCVVKGCMPEIIDHIDHNRLNNKIENLRSVTHKQNIRHGSGRQAGITRKGNKFLAAIRVDYVRRHLGTFKTYDEALIARKKAEEELWGLV